MSKEATKGLKTSRIVCKCGACSKFKDLIHGRFLPLLKPKMNMDNLVLFKGVAWICHECLPLDEIEQEELKP